MKIKEYSKTFDLGKVKINKRTLQIKINAKLTIENHKPFFRSFLEIDNEPCILMGFLLPNIHCLKPKQKQLFYKWYMWETLYSSFGRVHLGTPEQEKAIELLGNPLETSYNEKVKFLKSIGLYNVRGVRYGQFESYDKIPNHIVKEMKQALQ